eukprot:COSAG01_NODE_491_length_16354_cov_26.550784_14_plen_153_part_00
MSTRSRVFTTWWSPGQMRVRELGHSVFVDDQTVIEGVRLSASLFLSLSSPPSLFVSLSASLPLCLSASPPPLSRPSLPVCLSASLSLPLSLSLSLSLCLFLSVRAGARLSLRAPLLFTVTPGCVHAVPTAERSRPQPTVYLCIHVAPIFHAY